MKTRDFVFVTLVAFGIGWTLAAIVLETLAAGENHSVLWVGFARFFLALACASFAIAIARAAWRVMRPWGWLAGAAGVAVALSVLSVSLGDAVSAWLTVGLGFSALVSQVALPAEVA